MNRPTGNECPLDGLVDLLDLRTEEQDRFTGRSPRDGPSRVFGGQLVGQALMAAGRTVPPERSPHCAQTVFLRPGNPAQPLRFEVERLREGGSFSLRRVTVRQQEAVFCMTVSFQTAEGGPERAPRAPAVPPPGECPAFQERLGRMAGRMGGLPEIVRPVDVRYVGEAPWERTVRGPSEPGHRAWMRADGTLPDDPLVHRAVLGYASDLTLVDSILIGQGVYWGDDPVLLASLNHTVWFHRSFRADDWLLYDCASPGTGGGRGMATGRFFDADGRLVASVVQEALFRVRE